MKKLFSYKFLWVGAILELIPIALINVFFAHLNHLLNYPEHFWAMALLSQFLAISIGVILYLLITHDPPGKKTGPKKITIYRIRPSAMPEKDSLADYDEAALGIALAWYWTRSPAGLFYSCPLIFCSLSV